MAKKAELEMFPEAEVETPEPNVIGLRIRLDKEVYEILSDLADTAGMERSDVVAVGLLNMFQTDPDKLGEILTTVIANRIKNSANAFTTALRNGHNSI